jgi:hypothetical protein
MDRIDLSQVPKEDPPASDSQTTPQPPPEPPGQPPKVMMEGGPTPAPPPPCAIVVIETIVWRPGTTSPPPQCESKFSRQLNSDDAPYARDLKNVGQEWQKVPLGWVVEAGGSCGMLSLQNVKAPRSTYPTPAEQAAIDAKVVEVGFDGCPDDLCWLILPGESMRGVPSQKAQDGALRVRCRKGACTVRITAFPF